MKTILETLIKSRKAWIVVLALIAVAILAGIGKIPVDQFIDFSKWCVTAWLGSIAIEDAGKSIANASQKPTVLNLSMPRKDSES